MSIALSMLSGLCGCYSASAPGAGHASGFSPGGPGQAVLGSTSPSTGLGCDVDGNAEQMAKQVLTLINLERAKVGVDPLRINVDLTQAAEDYACTMAAEDFFDHVHPLTGEGPADRAALAGYEFFSVGENLAAGQPTAAEAVESWMKSSGHRSNLLSPEWKETGVGVRRGGTYRIYWVQEFGKPGYLRQAFGQASLTAGG